MSTTRFEPFAPVVVLLAGYVVVAVFTHLGLGYDFMQADVQGYWRDSLQWQAPFNPFHVPAYPLAIAAARGVTMNLVPPVLLMMGVNLLALVSSIVLVYRIAQAGGASEHASKVASLFFGLWPFVGLTYTVAPMADLPSMALLLAGLYGLIRSRTLTAACFLGLALVTHKAIWVFVVLVVLAYLLSQDDRISKESVLLVGITLLPIAVLWLAGSWYHGSLSWLTSSNMRVDVEATSGWAVFQGFGGALGKGGLIGFSKLVVLVAMLGASVLLIPYSISIRYKFVPYGVALSLAVILLFATIGSGSVWAAVRFSRLLVLPLIWALSLKITQVRADWRTSAVTVAALLLFLSQLAFSWYWAQVRYQ